MTDADHLRIALAQIEQHEIMIRVLNAKLVDREKEIEKLKAYNAEVVGQLANA